MALKNAKLTQRMNKNLLFPFIQCNRLIKKLSISKLVFLILISYSFALSGQTSQQVQFTTPGDGTWTVPCGVTSITVEAWGGGGGGGARIGNNAGSAGGGGGAYVRRTISVQPGTYISYFVGAGGSGKRGLNVSQKHGGSSWFKSTSEIFAEGGRSVVDDSSNNNNSDEFVRGGLAVNSIGSVKYNGGSGGFANGGAAIGGGGGGGAGHPAGEGTQGATGGKNRVGGGGGTSSADNLSGGKGGNGGSSGSSGLSGTGAGSGGGGGQKYGSAVDGGNGSAGMIRITYLARNYCIKTFTTVRPITYVGFAGINNTIPADATASYQEFCQTAQVKAGSNYLMTVKGNTKGNRVEHISVFIDWNNDGTFDDKDDEIYRLGSITNSTGIDNLVLRASIAVPKNAPVGIVKMRIIKTDIKETSFCNSDGNSGKDGGQVQDYWVSVSAAQPCVTPAAPSNLQLTYNGVQVSGMFTASVPQPSGYVIMRSRSATAPVPEAGKHYISGTKTGDYFVLHGNESPYTATSFTDVIESGDLYYYVFAYNDNCSGGPVYSAALVKDLAICAPFSQTAERYISEVGFVGSLAPDFINTSGYSPNGYHNYTGLPQRAIQVPGGVVNMNVRIQAPAGQPLSTLKAWVDWNGDGVFSSSEIEKVYDTNPMSVLVSNVIFGFVVPANTAPGLYTVRVRASSSGNAWGACGMLENGETEDYVIEVVADCSARIISASVEKQQCGPGTVTLTAEATQDTTMYYWYDSAFGAPVYTSASNTFTTPDLNAGLHTYYVAASNGSCNSLFRFPVTFRINPIPAITFTPSAPDICGSVSSVILDISAEKEEVTLIDEKFEKATVGFSHSTAGNAEPAAFWQLRQSPYIPEKTLYYSVRPAISSGYSGGRFANIITDVAHTSDILNYFTLTNPINTEGVTGLKLDFDLYFFAEDHREERNYLRVQYSADGGASWNTLKTYVNDTGTPGRFARESVLLPESAQNQEELLIRFAQYAYGTEGEWMASITALDNLRLYGNKEVAANYSWTGMTGIILDENCENPADLATATRVCLRPTEEELLTQTDFTVSVTASLASSCAASGTFELKNNNKVRREAGAGNWSEALWQPLGTAPTLEHCARVETPLVVADQDGEARTITIGPAGSIVIPAKRALTVADAIINTRTAAAFVVESDANLVQINDLAENRGPITVKRDAYMKRLDYTYWGSPVEGQQLKAFSPGTLNTRFYTYNEYDDLFSVINPSSNFKAGKGYAVRSPNNFPSDNVTYQTFNGVFTGIPTNGEVSFPLEMSHNGYNLISNPYSSNIDIEALRTLNAGKITAAAYFWTNINKTPAMQGSNYPNGGYINNYAVLNGTGSTPATYSETPVNPNNGAILKSHSPTQYIKVGQGFIVKARNGNEPLIFNNSIRTTNQESNFFNNQSGRAKSKKDRFWLQLTTPMGVVTTMLVGYVPEATNDYEIDYDATLMGVGSDAIYTKLYDKSLQIQGRQYPLVTSDVVALETNHDAAGVHTISMTIAEGIFETDQPVYLKDYLTGKQVNLREESYSFMAEAGPTSGRFELQYLPEQILGTGSETKETLKLYRNGEQFTIAAVSKKITEVKVYDTAGRLIMSQQPQAIKVYIPASMLADGIYIVTIRQGETVQTRKIVK